MLLFLTIRKILKLRTPPWHCVTLPDLSISLSAIRVVMAAQTLGEWTMAREQYSQHRLSPTLRDRVSLCLRWHRRASVTADCQSKETILLMVTDCQNCKFRVCCQPIPPPPQYSVAWSLELWLEIFVSLKLSHERSQTERDFRYLTKHLNCLVITQTLPLRKILKKLIFRTLKSWIKFSLSQTLIISKWRAAHSAACQLWLSAAHTKWLLHPPTASSPAPASAWWLPDLQVWCQPAPYPSISTSHHTDIVWCCITTF